MKSFSRSIGVAASCVTQFALVSLAHAAGLQLPRDGWSSWEVAAVDDAPAWCCWSWNDRDMSAMSCRLDGDNGGYGSRNDATTDTVRVYARMAAGKVNRLHVFAAECPVVAATPIHEIGNVAPDDSAWWLIGLVTEGSAAADPRDETAENALAALAMHRTEVAGDGLAEIARESRTETRKHAVFWAAQLRGVEGADIASYAMFNDKDPDVREHAAFAMSQTGSPRAAADLIRQGNTDKDDDVRAQAWFWLAQTGALEAEGAIGAALRKDKDEHVRNQAIFALSQLPDERAPKALIAAAEDRSLSREQRKQAVFWLSESTSEVAQAYVEKVLERAATH